MRFYLGTHQVDWLSHAGVPLFVSYRRLHARKRLPRATVKWCMDSGGFTELSMHGRWTLTTRDYAAGVRRMRDEIGGMQWAAPQDWMCEPFMLQKTGLSLNEHQRRTIANVQELRTIAPDLPFIPVLQGWVLGDYLRHAEDYQRAGVDLQAEPVVGVGSVCRRQGTREAATIIRNLAGMGLRVHGFGFKTRAMSRCRDRMASADSLAWSYRARRSKPLPGCTHKSCANCLRFALQWRQRVLAQEPSRQQEWPW